MSFCQNILFFANAVQMKVRRQNFMLSALTWSREILKTLTVSFVLTAAELETKLLLSGDLWLHFETFLWFVTELAVKVERQRLVWYIICSECLKKGNY